MADITMCLKHDCKLKEKCKRYVAKASNYQSYFDPKAINNDCKHFIEATKIEIERFKGKNERIR